ncbi:hypothetical protein A7K99_17595 [Tatumella citrea]|uniref:Uncharacterized protein n=1 Tax=Tatumella citrea TaxID=53336 RepID=A0A1Y0LP01_TATCI|nr:hypothetical protein A7K98_17610 [Tatumella citrea]ARU99440.1 hypothetical protein A7K99_17595 [Tatumella citrea]
MPSTQKNEDSHRKDNNYSYYYKQVTRLTMVSFPTIHGGFSEIASRQTTVHKHQIGASLQTNEPKNNKSINCEPVVS